MTMKAKIFTLFFAILLIFVSCKTQEATIKIGVSQPLTGPTAFVGEWIKQGLDLAYSELPKEEQSQIVLVYEDDMCNGQQAVTAMQKLVNIDAIDFVIGPTCNAAIIPTQDFMRESGAVYLTTGVITEKAAAAGDHHFTLQPRIKDLMKKLASHAYKVDGMRAMSIFYLDDEFGVESSQFFERYFTELGGKIVAKERFAPKDTDYRTQITKLKQHKVDGIFMMSYGPFLVNQLKQMDELKLKSQLYGPVPVQDAKLLQAAGKLAEGLTYPYPQETTKSQKQIEFEERYKAKFGIQPELYSTIAYDTFNILHQIIGQCGKDKTCAKNNLITLQNYQGVGGVLSFDEEGIGKRSIIIKQVKNEKFVIAENDK